MEKKLRVKPSKFKSPLTYNEWVEKYKVSSGYVEPTKYFQGNAGSRRLTMDTRMEISFSGDSPDQKKQNLLGKLLSYISF